MALALAAGRFGKTGAPWTDGRMMSVAGWMEWSEWADRRTDGETERRREGGREGERGALLLPSVFSPLSFPQNKWPARSLGGSPPLLPVPPGGGTARSLSHSTHLSLSLSVSVSVLLSRSPSFFHQFSFSFSSLLRRRFDNIPLLSLLSSFSFLLVPFLLSLCSAVPSSVPRMQQGRVILLARCRRPSGGGGEGGDDDGRGVAVAGTIKFSCTALRLLARSLSLSLPPLYHSLTLSSLPLRRSAGWLAS